MPPPWSWVPRKRNKARSVVMCTGVHCPQDFSAAVRSPMKALSSPAYTPTHRSCGPPPSLNLYLWARFPRLRNLEAYYPKWRGPIGLCWLLGQERSPSSGGLNHAAAQGEEFALLQRAPQASSLSSSKLLQTSTTGSGGAGKQH